ncbi:hypothetical protein ONS95_001917 [Cadophora gregata]|uniref:uncharacterized protein n=1 Tax=Cadophora gregata TaxID=51156 RepID=UPI0026DAA2ED|nr:uncharacterized protein ONS95_001917 [Cadophora gregata]KAK0111567.1 hypothetical protein ONS95_001917 [Cadophora gregata]KAK0111958.1 hypothetical protein ONS96_001221 [Cadophora gregata f. sp. sojae]
MRLRTLVAQKSLWHGEYADVAVRVRILEVAVQRAVGREILVARMALCEAMLYMVSYRAILSMLRDIESMLAEEALDGWDWRVGLRAQLDARDRLYYKEIGNLSAVAEERYTLASLPSGIA